MSFATVLVAGFGPVTGLIEGVAVSVGAGVLLAGFGAGIFGVALGWEAARRERAVASFGYMGGAGAACAVAADALILG